jgi:hypothetical protein
MPRGPCASFSGGDNESTASDVHATLCALVKNAAAEHEAWAQYAAILLDEETAAFFAARLTEGKGVTDGDKTNPPPNKKCKLRANVERSGDSGLAIAPICEHCGGTVPEISLRVASLDGTTLDVTVAQRGLVQEVKGIVGKVILVLQRHVGISTFSQQRTLCTLRSPWQLRDIDPGLIELFVDGKEDGLPDAGRLDEQELGEGSVVFMLHRAGWRWEARGSQMTLSEDGLVASRESYGWQLVTGGSPMTEGRHYWEVEMTTWAGGGLMVGAVRPGLDHDRGHFNASDAYFVDAEEGSLNGNGKDGDDVQGRFAEGDRVGVLLDLDAGWIRVYRNGRRCGPGFTEGVTGPLVRAGHVVREGDTVTALPGAAAPEGAGGADEPWEGAPNSESVSDY